MNLIVKMVIGSKLYGTSTSKSDTDYVGAYMPTVRDLILKQDREVIDQGTGSDTTKNTSEDTDYKIYSIQKFLHLAYQGDTGAIDMLCAPKECWLEYTPEWEFIHNNRHKFFTKKTSAFLGYARRQAKIYSQKGEKLNLFDELLENISVYQSLSIVSVPTLHNFKSFLGADLWKMIVKYTDANGNKELDLLLPSTNEANQKETLLEVAGRKFQLNMRLKDFEAAIKTMKSKYGNRAKEAQENKGDFKAISHAFRVIWQMDEILKTGDLVFPLKRADEVLRIKSGDVDVQECYALLSKEFERVQADFDKSNLPTECDKAFFENWLCEVYNK